MAVARRKFAGSRDFRPDERIAEKYRLLRRIAIGGMGQVWVARNLATHGDVAVKLLRRGGSNPEHEEEVSQRFRNEARLSVNLAHRNIVRVYDLVEDSDGTLCLVMELLRGETLFDRIGRLGPMSGVQGLAAVIPILSGLSHAHEQGIVHRDVTPANIYLAVDPDGHVTPKLVDFGLAKPVSEEAAPAVPIVRTLEGRVLGTPMYMAPERIRGERSLDARSDIFSVGVVLYELLTGESPFAAPTPAASLAAVLERQVDPDPRIGPQLWLEIRRAMAKQAYERHATARELTDALLAAVSPTTGELTTAIEPAPGWNASGSRNLSMPSLPPTATNLLTGPARARRKTAIVGASIGGALLVGLAAAAAMHRPPADHSGTADPAIAAASASAAAAAAAAAPEAHPTPTETAAPTATAAAPASAQSAATLGVGPTPTHGSSSASPVRAPHHGGGHKPVATNPGF